VILLLNSAMMVPRQTVRLAGHALMKKIASRPASSLPQYEFLAVSSPSQHVAHVQLNRPDKRNGLSLKMWREIGECFDSLGTNETVRSIVLSGNGKHFCSGIDLMDFMQTFMQISGKVSDVGRRAAMIDRLVKDYQDWFTAIEQCPKPVIAAIHSGCIGGGVDLVTACDMRHCTEDAWFQVKEVQIGLAADVGTLQRLPKVLNNDSMVRELCYSGRAFPSHEALTHGLVSKVHPDKEAMLTAALDLAATIARNSPVAVQGTKRSLVYSRDHPVQAGLDHVRQWNMSMLQSEDVMKAAKATATKSEPSFSDL
jgi:delta(3,5)-delta(2,4)-dienoyl-CoA isomerase